MFHVCKRRKARVACRAKTDFYPKDSKGLLADFLFLGVRNVGTLATIILDLREWDHSDTLFENIDALQQEEVSFQERLWGIYSKFRCCIAMVLVDGENSRQRFNRTQSRLVRMNVNTRAMLASINILGMASTYPCLKGIQVVLTSVQ